MKNQNSENNIVLITGRAGFIGFHLTKRLLLNASGLKVIGIDNMNDYYDVGLKNARLEELLKFDAFIFICGVLQIKTRLRKHSMSIIHT